MVRVFPKLALGEFVKIIVPSFRQGQYGFVHHYRVVGDKTQGIYIQYWVKFRDGIESPYEVHELERVDLKVSSRLKALISEIQALDVFRKELFE
jgi:hypothetical protein